MSQPTHTTANLAEAWYDRYARALHELLLARRAPALFKPERIRQLEADARRAEAEVERWAAQ